MSKRNQTFASILTIAALIVLASNDVFPQLIKPSLESNNTNNYEQQNYTKSVYYTPLDAGRLEKARVSYYKGDYKTAIANYELIKKSFFLNSDF